MINIDNTRLAVLRLRQAGVIEASDDGGLYLATIRLAQTNPELGRHLRPILFASPRVARETPSGKFRNPETGNKVNFDSLPSAEQAKIRNRGRSDGKKDEGDNKKKDEGNGGSQPQTKVKKHQEFLVNKARSMSRDESKYVKGTGAALENVTKDIAKALKSNTNKVPESVGTLIKELVPKIKKWEEDLAAKKLSGKGSMAGADGEMACEYAKDLVKALKGVDKGWGKKTLGEKVKFWKKGELRLALIRVATEHPETRRHLIPLLARNQKHAMTPKQAARLIELRAARCSHQ